MSSFLAPATFCLLSLVAGMPSPSPSPAQVPTPSTAAPPRTPGSPMAPMPAPPTIAAQAPPAVPEVATPPPTSGLLTMTEIEADMQASPLVQKMDEVKAKLDAMPSKDKVDIAVETAAGTAALGAAIGGIVVATDGFKDGHSVAAQQSESSERHVVKVLVPVSVPVEPTRSSYHILYEQNTHNAAAATVVNGLPQSIVMSFAAWALCSCIFLGVSGIAYCKLRPKRQHFSVGALTLSRMPGEGFEPLAGDEDAASLI